jgi:uncharacterized membrane protein YhaH (DUF805 family)
MLSERFRDFRIKRLPFLLWGAGLFALKIPLDALVFHAFGQPYSPLVYINAAEAPLFNPSRNIGLWFSLWAVALPFLLVGVTLTLARLRDANLPRWMMVFFFLPFANLLFFLTLPWIPSREATPERAGRERLPRVSRMTALFLSAALGAVIFLAAMGISIGLLKEYGAGLFVGAPFFSGFAAVLLLIHLDPLAKFWRSFLAAAMACVLCFTPILFFAIEGLICLVMAAPILLVLVFLGAGLGYLVARGTRRPAPLAVSLAFGFPLIFALDLLFPTQPDLREVRSEIVVAAPPTVVWKHVISFSELPPPTELMFKVGVACPQRAVIHGSGVGAVRHCEFTTGAFVEPVTVWKPGEELSFRVAAQPDALRELTLWKGVRPPHLDGYIQSKRGQFKLEAMPGGKTRLIGTTWYELRIGPEAYWAQWSDPLIHAIHLRVLRHVRDLSESDRG